MRKKLRCIFDLFAFLENTCFVCKGCATLWEKVRYNFYFEALKGLLLKNAPYFFSLIFLENVSPLSRNMIKFIPLGASTSKYKMSAFSMWLYEDEI